MLLVFEDDKSKGNFMESLSKLGKAEPKYNKITVVHDLTQKETQRNKEKWGECKEKNKELESDPSIKFISASFLSLVSLSLDSST
jgi:hypothetical protein